MVAVLARRKQGKSVILSDNIGGSVASRNSTRRILFRRFPQKTLLVLILLLPLEAGACGWWGDGEMNRDQLIPEIISGGRQIPLFLDRDSIILPGSLGYGMAITEPGQAQPYLRSTYGRPISSIEDLGAYGFRAMIDLAPLAGQRSREYTEELPQQMHYFHVPVESLIPSQIQIAGFRDLLLDADNLPAFVVAPAAEVLAVMWAAYRLEFGTPFSYVIAEARPMGLRPEQESALNLK